MKPLDPILERIATSAHVTVIHEIYYWFTIAVFAVLFIAMLRAILVGLRNMLSSIRQGVFLDSLMAGVYIGPVLRTIPLLAVGFLILFLPLILVKLGLASEELIEAALGLEFSANGFEFKAR